MSTPANPSSSQFRRNPPLMTDHIELADQALSTIRGTSVGAEILARFLKEHPQIETPGTAPRYLVMGSLAVAALTENQRCWEDCNDISLMHTGKDQTARSTWLTKSHREKNFSVIKTYELDELNVKLRGHLHVHCKPVVDSNNKILSFVLVPHPAALMVLTAADVFEVRDDARGARDCEALLGLLEGLEPTELSAELREWRKLISDTYEGLQVANRECAYHAIENAVKALAERSENSEFLQLIPNRRLETFGSR